MDMRLAQPEIQAQHGPEMMAQVQEEPPPVLNQIPDQFMLGGRRADRAGLELLKDRCGF